MLPKLILTCAASVASWLSWLSFSPSECVRWRRRELRLGRDGTEPARDRNQPASAVSPLVVGGGPPAEAAEEAALAAGDCPRGVVWGAAGGVRPKGEGERPLLREEEPSGISMNLVSEEVLLRPEELEDVEIWKGGRDGSNVGVTCFVVLALSCSSFVSCQLIKIRYAQRLNFVPSFKCCRCEHPMKLQ